jgi:C_GCAxxG_C_C family probable redox protein
MKTPPEAAVERFTQDHNCAQSVLAAFAPSLGFPEEQALKLASLFGAGMARRGRTCGAVTGGLMALGLKFGNLDPEGKDAAYAVAREFMSQFEQRHGTLTCRELVGCDISIPEEREKARQAGVFAQLCPRLVREAAEIVQGLLAAEPGPAK